MELRHLRSFILVAETASFSVAASRCYLTQSAVSQHIKALEEELKCKLLIRSSHSITLTECGETLFVQAKEILKFSDDCIEQVSGQVGYSAERVINAVNMGDCKQILLRPT